jgi:hypothetical protein
MVSYIVRPTSRRSVSRASAMQRSCHSTRQRSARSPPSHAWTTTERRRVPRGACRRAPCSARASCRDVDHRRRLGRTRHPRRRSRAAGSSATSPATRRWETIAIRARPAASYARWNGTPSMATLGGASANERLRSAARRRQACGSLCGGGLRNTRFSQLMMPVVGFTGGGASTPAMNERKLISTAPTRNVAPGGSSRSPATR